MTQIKQPNVYSLVRGKGEGLTTLNAFDAALLNAGIGDTNLMQMSSIIPPGAMEVDELNLPAGALVPLAYASVTNSDPGTIISAAIAVAIPEDPELAGVIMEHAAEERLTEVKEKVYEMAVESFRYRKRKLKNIKTLGIEHTVENHGAAFAATVLWYR